MLNNKQSFQLKKMCSWKYGTWNTCTM